MKDIIVKMVKDGFTYKQVRDKLGCSLSTISYHCKKNGIMSKHTSIKIDDLTIQKMIKLYEEKKSCLKVAKILGVSKSTVLKYIDTKNTQTKLERKENNVKQVIYWRIKVKKKLVEYKGGKCERCGYDRCIDSLEFHHLDPNEKDFTIGGKSFSFERLRIESDKCILICSNCHKEIHFEERKKKNVQMVEWRIQQPAKL